VRRCSPASGEPKNHRPRRFYEEAGWQLDGARRTKAWLGVEFDEVRYRLPL